MINRVNQPAPFPGGPLFRSFWMAGYECTDKLNAFGHRVDFLNITGHIEKLDEDYRSLQLFNIKTVREGIRWSQVEKTPYHYDWSVAEMMIRKARQYGIQQIWDMCHFGFPDDLTPLHPLFPARFSSLCHAFVEFYRSLEPIQPLIIIPINEVSFLSWLGGDARGTSPYCTGQGWEVKYHLMKAYIEGVARMKDADRNIRILTSEPLVQIVPPLDATAEQIAKAAESHIEQFQAVDMLCGRMCPELGGSPDYLDMLGFNFYYNNHWEYGMGHFLPWANIDPDPRFISLGTLLMQACSRYDAPFLITETGHSGEHRPNWIEYITRECIKVIRLGAPLMGVCLYPIIDRPDWDHLSPWHGSGLWDAVAPVSGIPERCLYQPMADAFIQSQFKIDEVFRQQAFAMQW